MKRTSHTKKASPKDVLSGALHKHREIAHSTQQFFSQLPRIRFSMKGLSFRSKSLVFGFQKVVQDILKRVPNIDLAEIVVQEKKKGKLFRAEVKVAPKSGKTMVIAAESPNLQMLFLDIVRKLRRLLRRN